MTTGGFVRVLLSLDRKVLARWRASDGADVVADWWAANHLPPAHLVRADTLAVVQRPDGTRLLRYNAMPGRRVRDGQRPAEIPTEQLLVVAPPGLP